MRKLFTVIAIFLLLSEAICGEDTSARIRALQKLLEYKTDTSTLVEERESLIRAASIISPRGEYESSEMYQRRVNAAQQKINQIQAEYATKISDYEQLANQRRQQIKNQIDELLMKTQETFNTTLFRFLTYDPDNQVLPLYISEINQTISAQVPLARAEYVKTNATKYSLQATRQLNEQLQWSYNNWFLVGEGERYVVGTHQGRDNYAASKTNYMPPDLKASAVLIEPSGNKILDAEEAGAIEVTIKNEGLGSAYAVDMRVSANMMEGIVFDQSLYFGEIGSGQTATQRIALSALSDVQDRQQSLTLSFTEMYQFPPDQINLSFKTKAIKMPNLVLADKGISDDGKITPGAISEVRLRIQNTGQGTARNAYLEIKSGDVVHLLDTPVRMELGDLEPGRYKDVDIKFAVAKTATDLPLSIRIAEERERFSTDFIPLDLKLNQRQKTTQDIVVQGNDRETGSVSVSQGLSVDIESNIPKGKAKSDAYAVIIGIENYQNLPPAPHAVRDAEWVKEYFQQSLGIPPTNILTYTNDKATMSQFIKLFEGGYISRLIQQKKADLYVYFSGHGSPPPPNQDKPFLAAWDSDFASIEYTCYPVEKVYNALNELKTSNVTVFLDACFSGISKDSKPLKSGKPVYVSPASEMNIGKITLFTAGEFDQIAHIYNDKKHSVFTYHLLKGIHNRAADFNKDGKITIAEFKKYLSEEVPKLSMQLENELQNPQIYTADLNRVLIEYK
ncbi:MAG: caspase family protein [Candidatus Cloacimonetes bacterium]|nr:caspase family protein [Candidatus Cloacimonadota bacterium]